MPSTPRCRRSYAFAEHQHQFADSDSSLSLRDRPCVPCPPWGQTLQFLSNPLELLGTVPAPPIHHHQFSTGLSYNPSRHLRRGVLPVRRIEIRPIAAE